VGGTLMPARNESLTATEAKPSRRNALLPLFERGLNQRIGS
jgi:hypothetical protein